MARNSLSGNTPIIRAQLFNLDGTLIILPTTILVGGLSSYSTNQPIQFMQLYDFTTGLPLPVVTV